MAARRLLIPLLCVALLATFVALRWQALADVEPRLFNDSPGYLRPAARRLTSRKLWLNDRWFVVPLVYRIAGADPARVIVVQWLVSIAAWGTLAVVAARTIRSPALRPLALASVLAFAASTPVAQWDGNVLSDSLALSVTALFVACGLRLAERVTTGRALLACATGAALVFTRDAYSPLLLMLAALVAASAALASRRRTALFVAGAFAVAALTTAAVAQGRQPWFHSSLNVLADRILPHPDRLAYFAERGLPVNDALLRQTAVRDHLPFYKSPDLAEFRRWWKAHGTSTYTGFLLSRPVETVAGPLREGWRLVSPRLDHYVPDGWAAPLGAAGDRLIHPAGARVLYWVAAVVLVTAAAVARRGRAPAVWLAPALLLVTALPFAVVVWHADARDIDRHVLPVDVHVRLALLLLFWLGLDHFLRHPASSGKETS